jgi:hypothetical protein
MIRWVRETTQSLRAYPGFALAVLVTLGLAGLIGGMTLLMQLQPGFMGMAHGTEPSHRAHDLTYGFLFLTAVVGILVQLRRPLKNAAGMLMALTPWMGLLLAAILSTDAGVILSAERILVGVGSIAAAFLHPMGRRYSVPCAGSIPVRLRHFVAPADPPGPVAISPAPAASPLPVRVRFPSVYGARGTIRDRRRLRSRVTSGTF